MGIDGDAGAQGLGQHQHVPHNSGVGKDVLLWPSGAHQYVEKGTNSFGTATSWAAEVKGKDQTCRWRWPHHPLTAKGSSQSGLLMYIIITHEKEEQWRNRSFAKKIMEINVLSR